MIEHLFSAGLKSAGLTVAGISGLMIATAEVGDERIFGLSINAVRELGSFGMIVIFILSVLWLLRKIVELVVPKVVEFLESTATKFLAELAAERSARSQGMQDFREMLHSHKVDIVASTVIQTQVLEKLHEELSRRPCLHERAMNSHPQLEKPQ